VELKSTNVDKFIKHALQHGRRKLAAVPEKKAKPAKPAKPANINSSLQLLGQAYKLAIADGRLSTAPRIRKLSELGKRARAFSPSWSLAACWQTCPRICATSR
jgi:hypothetical protein